MLDNRYTLAILLLILLLAATLRLFKLDQSPAGFHADEASNAWNAYTLLKTGKDQHGVRWPIFYTRAFGENRSTSYIYTLIPFQALGGMNVWTTRLPAAMGGVVTVLLIYFVGARLFDRATGLVAAAMLALNPWHIQTSRWGHESSIVPLLVLAPLAALLWVNLPFDDHEERSPRLAVAGFAGGITGISCYGYWAVRLFLPVFLFGAVLVTWRGWWERLKRREWRLAIGTLLIVGSVTFGPLLWKHLTDPEIGKRAEIAGWVWNESDTLVEKIDKVLGRYPGHFGLDFLFIHGDLDPAYSPPSGIGLFYWYDLPLMALGLITCVSRARSSRAARLLLVWVLTYPIADLLNQHPNMHGLRSLPGLCALVLLPALGLVAASTWLWQRQRQAAVVIFCIMGFLVIQFNGRFLSRFLFGDFSRPKYAVYQVALLEAVGWLRSRLMEVDAVFITGQRVDPDLITANPYIITLVGLRYDPEQWFRDVRKVMPGPLPTGVYQHADIYLRSGRIYFMHDSSSLDALKELIENGRRDRVILILSPGELGMNKRANPVYEARNPEARVVLQVFDVVL